MQRIRFELELQADRFPPTIELVAQTQISPAHAWVERARQPLTPEQARGVVLTLAEDYLTAPVQGSRQAVLDATDSMLGALEQTIASLRDECAQRAADYAKLAQGEGWVPAPAPAAPAEEAA